MNLVEVQGQIKLHSEKQVLELEGFLGKSKHCLHGNSSIILSSKIFCYTKGAKNTLMSRLTKLFLGLNTGFFQEFYIEGLGYRSFLIKDQIILKLGFSHYISLGIPQSLKVLVYKKKILIFSLNLQELKDFGYKLESLKKANAYKTKGLVAVGKKIVLKIGKQQ